MLARVAPYASYIVQAIKKATHIWALGDANTSVRPYLGVEAAGLRSSLRPATTRVGHLRLGRISAATHRVKDVAKPIYAAHVGLISPIGAT